MVLFTILLCVLLTVVTILLSITGVIGTAALITFGDLAVCVLIIVLLVKLFTKKK